MIKDKLVSVWDWTVRSSADPKKVSLSIKSALVLAVPYVVSFGPLLGITADTVGLNELAANIADLAGVGLTIIGGIGLAMGLIRKILIAIYQVTEDHV